MEARRRCDAAPPHSRGSRAAQASGTHVIAPTRTPRSYSPRARAKSSAPSGKLARRGRSGRVEGVRMGADEAGRRRVFAHNALGARGRVAPARCASSDLQISGRPRHLAPGLPPRTPAVPWLRSVSKTRTHPFLSRTHKRARWVYQLALPGELALGHVLVRWCCHLDGSGAQSWAQSRPRPSWPAASVAKETVAIPFCVPPWSEVAVKVGALSLGPLCGAGGQELAGRSPAGVDGGGAAAAPARRAAAESIPGRGRDAHSEAQRSWITLIRRPGRAPCRRERGLMAASVKSSRVAAYSLSSLQAAAASAPRLPGAGPGRMGLTPRCGSACASAVQGSAS